MWGAFPKMAKNGSVLQQQLNYQLLGFYLK
jgi:hypothetical protein